MSHIDLLNSGQSRFHYLLAVLSLSKDRGDGGSLQNSSTPRRHYGRVISP